MQPPQQHDQQPEHEHNTLPWLHLLLAILILVLLAILVVLFFYTNPGITLTYGIVTALGLLIAFLQLAPSLFPSKRPAPPQLPPIHIHTPHSPLPSSTSPQLDVPLPAKRKFEKEDEEIDNHATFPSIWHVPYRRNPFFTGREDILKRLHELLTAGNPSTLLQPQAINGLGGIGKTQTVLEYAYRYREHYQTVFWARAESLDTLVADFVAFTDLLKLPEYAGENLSIAVNAAKRWLETHTGWLLILDNADDLSMVSNFLPAHGKGSVLLTSRAQAMSDIAHTIPIETMKPEEGSLFLLRRAKIIDKDEAIEDAPVGDRAIAEEIARLMDGLPLALDQAGAYIEETDCSLSEYLALYNERHLALLQRRGGLAHNHPESVATTWSLSFEKVEQNNPAAAELLRLCAFLNNDAIPEEIIIEGALELGPVLSSVAANQLVLNNAIGELRKFSFVRRNPAASTLTIHRLVQVILMDGMEKREQHVWVERAIRAINRVFPTITFATWQQCQRYLPQIQICSELIRKYDFTFPEAIQLLEQVAYFLQEHAYYNLAEELYLQSLAIYEANVGPEHVDTAKILNSLGYLYYLRGKYAQAEPIYLRAITIIEPIPQQELSENVNALHNLERLNYNLGRLYFAQGKYALAEPRYLRALSIVETFSIYDYPQATRVLNNLGRLYQAQGKYSRAEELYLRALAITEQNPEVNLLNTAHILNNLARLYRTQENYDEAEKLYLRALAIRETDLGPDHPDIALTLNNLGHLYLTLDKHAQAEDLFLRALVIDEAVLGPEHPETATTLCNLAQLYYTQEKYQSAEKYYRRALAIREAALGHEHPSIANILTHLALLFCAQARYAEAEKLYLQALSIRESALGTEHPEVVEVLEYYIDLLRRTDRIATANKMSLRVQHINAKHKFND